MENNNKFGIGLKLAPMAVLSVCLLVTFLIWNEVRQNAAKELQLLFDAEVRDIHGRIDDRLSDYSNILRGTAGLFDASNFVTRQDFRIYVQGLKLDQTYPGIQGVGFARLIPAREKQRVVAAIRKEGFPNFTLRPEGVRDPYSAIVYLEPFDWRNQRAFGFDMYSEPVRRAAMEQARDHNAPAITGKVVLVQETEKEMQYGFLMYLPVYRNNLPNETLSERRNNLIGWVYEPFRMNDLMTRGVLGRYLDTIRNELAIEIYDGEVADHKSIMYDSLATDHVLSDSGHKALYVSSIATKNFGHSWVVVVRSLPPFEAKLKSREATIVAIVGVVISLLLTWVVLLQSTTNIRAIKLAERMSAKLEQTLTQTISAMATVTEMRDPYTAGHQRQAAGLARAIAKEMGLPDGQILVLYRAALTYEIGKIRIPAEILNKPGKLDEVEYGLIQTHVQAGFDIVSGIDFPWPMALIVQQHHERLDGSGYPHGLKGDEILLEARIIAVADVVVAMCSHRPYRPALGIRAALEEISSKQGVLYDPAVVHACMRLLIERGYQLQADKVY